MHPQKIRILQYDFIINKQKIFFYMCVTLISSMLSGITEVNPVFVLFAE